MKPNLRMRWLNYANLKLRKSKEVALIVEIITRRQVTLPAHVPDVLGVGRGDRLQLNQKENYRA